METTEEIKPVETVEPIKPAAPTSEEIKKAEAEKVIADKKARQDSINAKIEQLKTNIGKTFMRKDGTGNPVKITGYAGIFVKDGIAQYAFNAETNHCIWTPPATQFLEDYEEVQAKQTATDSLPI